MFRFPGVEREDDVFSSCLARAVCILREGWKGEGGGGGRLVVRLCSEYIF